MTTKLETLAVQAIAEGRAEIREQGETCEACIYEQNARCQHPGMETADWGRPVTIDERFTGGERPEWCPTRGKVLVVLG